MTTRHAHPALASSTDEARAGAASQRISPLFIGVVLTLALGAASLASVAFGARIVTLDEIYIGITNTPTDELGALAVRERLPRTVIALLAGAALAVSGALMQSLTRNPIADPGILGINTGAALAVVTGIAFFGATHLSQHIGLALVGALVTAFFVNAIGSAGPGGATPVKLALAGMATTAALSSLISAIMLPRAQGLDAFRAWQVGSLGRGTWQAILTLTPFLLVAAIITVVIARALDSLALGEEMAIGLGVNVDRTRALAALAGVILSATVTAIAGPIGFVGLMVPHVIRILIGPSHGWLLFLSALGGAFLLTTSDVIGRVLISPSEIPVAVITAFLGAPVLIAVARTAKVGLN
ncbi:FecCD family ABC transporter permease [Schaalia suimastitidis]|uniref:FecCD family ABC transporter permease n=1 Tax=Schaalia suimastitidis TaxID=121163 RepID=UPI00041F1E5A|nr:iron ABC transporter permease [Schaalia suimastitidis]